jgi:hypothetical protein
MLNSLVINNEKEIWKKIYIDDKETVYLISNFGRVYNNDTSRILKPVPEKRKGYQMIYLRVGKKKYCRFRIHRLVAFYFIENDDPKNKTQVDHIDGDKTNNSYHNLEWVTAKENVQRAFKSKIHPIYTCEDASHAQKTNEEIKLICEFMVKFPEVPLKKVARMFEVSYATIQNLRMQRQWKEITSQYDFGLKHDIYRTEKIKAEIDKLLLSGYGIKYIIKHLKWPDDFTEKNKYNSVYYRKTRLDKLRESSTTNSRLK